MNATRYEFQVNIFDDQLEESALCLLHTILFHRTTGKFQYQVSALDVIFFVNWLCQKFPKKFTIFKGIF